MHDTVSDDGVVINCLSLPNDNYTPIGCPFCGGENFLFMVTKFRRYTQQELICKCGASMKAKDSNLRDIVDKWNSPRVNF